MNLADLGEALIRRRTRVPTSRAFAVPDAPEIQSEAGYFQVHVAEMYLEFERKYLQRLAPATLCICDFKYGPEAKEVRVPFLVSNKMLGSVSEAGTDLGKIRVRFRDTRVLGPVPYRGGDVGLFAALYRNVIADERKALFSVFTKLLGASQVAAFLPYVQMAEKISDELSTLLGMDDMQFVVASREVFRRDARPLKGAYLALLDCEERAVQDMQLHVVDGQLRIGGESGVAFDKCDYCLLRLDTSETRDDVTGLPFHQKWKEARTALLKGENGSAGSALLACQRLIVESDDLTEDHRNKLIEFYQAAFLKEQQRIEGASSGTAAAQDHRGARGAARTLANLADLGTNNPRLTGSVASIGALVASDRIPSEDTDSDQAWAQAIQHHLGSAPAGKRGAARALADTLANVMVAPQGE